jgi:tetratricopeptide (TPR) repeat protein
MSDDPDQPAFIKLEPGEGYQFLIKPKFYDDEEGIAEWQRRGFSPSDGISDSALDLESVGGDETEEAASAAPFVKETTPEIGAASAARQAAPEIAKLTTECQTPVTPNGEPANLGLPATDKSESSAPADVSSAKLDVVNGAEAGVSLQRMDNAAKPSGGTDEDPTHLDEALRGDEPRREEGSDANLPHEQEDRPLSATEKWAEELARSASFETGPEGLFRQLFRRFLWAVCIIVGVVLLWLFAPHRWTTTAAIILLIGFIAHRLLRLRRQDRITIYVARLLNDNSSNDAQDLVMRSIRDELGSFSTKILPAKKIALSVAEGDVEQSTRAAQRFLREKHADILIWGKLYRRSEKNERLDLRFSVPDFEHRPNRTFGWLAPDECSLDSNFGPELGTAIAAMAASIAAPAVRNIGFFVSTALEPMADKLAKVVGDPGTMATTDRGALLQAYGLIHLAIGTRSGDRGHLKEAVDALRATTHALSRQRVPFAWAFSQNSLGLALMWLGEQEVGTEPLGEAASAFRTALDLVESIDDQRSGLRGAIRHNLGLALSRIGERESGLKHLERSVKVLRAALMSERKRPRSAAYIQVTLAEVLTRLGERKGDEWCLEEAAQLASSAAEKFAFPPAPDWARATLAYASAQTALGARGRRVELLKEAARAIRSVSLGVRRKRDPMMWVILQTRLAETLNRLGELDARSTSALHKSVNVIRGALDERLFRQAPGFWATAQNNLGVVSLKIAERERNATWALAAEEAFRNALKQLSPKEAPAPWAAAKHGLGSALVVLGSLQRDRSRYEAAVACFHEAAEACARQNDPIRWAYAQQNLAGGLIGLSAFEAGKKSLEEAVRRLQTVQNELMPESPPNLHRVIQDTLADALSQLQARGGTDDTPE